MKTKRRKAGRKLKEGSKREERGEPQAAERREVRMGLSKGKK